MATLHKSSYPGDWEYQAGEDFNEYRRRVDALFVAIPAGRVIKFPVADGYAFYYVHSEKPLVLQHIPYGDARRADAATIRGLRLADVQRMVKTEKALRAMFDAKRPGR